MQVLCARTASVARGGGHALYPKVKRVYIAGDIKDCKAGTVQKRSGRQVRGVRIE